MPQFFLNKRLIVLLISIIVLVALIGFSIRDRDELPWTEKFVKDIVGFGQSLVATPASYVAGFFEDVSDLQNTYYENQKLKAQLEELAVLETQVKDLDSDNQELRRLLNITENIRSFNPINATVYSRNPDQWNELLSISAGEAQNVEKDMAVISSKGLVGKIKTTNQFSSTVELITSTNTTNRISVEVRSEEVVFGLIEGFDQEKNKLLVKKIPFDKEIKEGDKVVTSGLGGVFPKNLLVGTVTEVIIDEFGLTKTAFVEPAGNFYDLEHVLVVDRELITNADIFEHEQKTEDKSEEEEE
ncbi:rod shape-determining protein MreC [Bacillus coahuilensis m2-6]|uniref:Cell shape-determining protein MreC n=1 Tax=Bacillus coahuilensis p1.1.43 TaxID=1150625 RepID=A0A147K724_9BACI|nr:rod shape-determining protein MreC [Bacillus coahuilensis]KUP05867.1 rod shape-determining protein MreC [Bacillus coahuilensis p1.1.43]KUP06963.1 rod shape-determining protein MreC [Bacillus coahuilensis m2-6]